MLAKRALRALVRLLLEIFFGEISVLNAERLPRAGPLILCANHPSAAMDALLLGAVFGTRIHYLAKATLFRNPLTRALLGYLGGIPIHRRQDGDGAPGDRNEATFEAARGLLLAGGWLAVFPEGRSVAGQRLMPLKTGTARIALSAEAGTDFDLRLQIVPVGLAYSAPTIFRSSVTVAVGEPIAVSGYQAIWRTDPQEAARRITAAIDDGLRRELCYVPEDSLEKLARAIEEIYETEGALGPTRPERQAGRAAIASAVLHFAEHDPTRVAEARRRLSRYRRNLARLALSDRAVAAAAGRQETRLPLLAELALLAPLAAYGWLNHVVPYNVPRLVVRLLRPDDTDVSSLKLASGTVAYALSYGLQVALCAHLTAWPAAVVYALSLPLSGLAALRFASRIELVRDALVPLRGLADRRRRRLLGRLASERERILDLLEEARRAMAGSAISG